MFSPTDPTPLFELFRGSYATELLTAAVAHFQIFGQLAQRPLTLSQLGQQLGLADRPVQVLVTALRSFGLLILDAQGRLTLTDLARNHLVPGAEKDVGDYIGLAANSPGVREMVERLKTNRPASSQETGGTAFIYREGLASAMEQEASARHFTLALAGRARNVAPILAEKLDLSRAKTLLDVGAGTGIYSIHLLQKFPHLEATLLDRPEVLRIAQDLHRSHSAFSRLRFLPGDMFRDPFPGPVDAILLSNILHDWDVPECRTLIRRCAQALTPGGLLLIHDVFLNDALDGPLPLALYSAALFTLTEGRAYSANEYRTWLKEAGLEPGALTLTQIHCGLLPATRPRSE